MMNYRYIKPLMTYCYQSLCLPECSKEFKYTVGESLKKETIELLTLIYRTNSRYEKNEVLQTAREQ
jgi:hypothetical protein